jgi:hypothetical protein
MTSPAAATQGPAPALSPGSAAGHGGGFLDVVRSEWTKLRTLRSTYWSVLAALVLAIGLGAAVSAAAASAYATLGPSDKATFDPTSASLTGLFFAQLALGVVGVLALSAEYSSGMIRTTLCAVPRRSLVLAAKAVVVAVGAFVVGIIATVVAFFLGQLIFSSKHLNVSFSDPGVARAVVGGALYVTVLVLLALGLAAIIRNTAGAITALVGLVFVLPPVSAALPSRWQDDLARYLPANAGSSILYVNPQGHSLSPWAGFGVFCVWAAVALVVGAVLLNRRDSQ